jgi:hypothetical protein
MTFRSTVLKQDLVKKLYPIRACKFQVLLLRF